MVYKEFIYKSGLKESRILKGHTGTNKNEMTYVFLKKLDFFITN